MVQRIRTLVVDDEHLARRTLEDLLATDSEIELCGSCSDGPSALKAILKERPDLILLDVQMPGLNGIQVIANVEKRLTGSSLPLVIFITAYDRYAIRAFERHALDYLLKPFGNRRFREAIARAKSRIRERGTAEFQRQLLQLLQQHAYDGDSPSLPQKPTATTAGGTTNTVPASTATGLSASSDPVTFHGKRLGIRDRGRAHFFDANDIISFEAVGQYVTAHTTEGEIMFRESLGRLQKKLEGGQFLRIHRSTIVNVAHIARVESVRAGGYEIHLKSGRRLAISRRRVGYVLKRLGL